MKDSNTKGSLYRRKVLSCFAVAGLVLVGCHSWVTPEQNTPARQTINSATSDFEKAFAQTNTVGIASYYTPDGELLLVSEPPIRDRDNIAEFFGNFFLHSGATKIQFKPTQFQQAGSFANETGTFVTSTADGRTVLDGNYIAIWRLVGTQWKIQVQALSPTRQNDQRELGRDGPHGLIRS
jgi:ketosteroid isomerase-like protein